LLYYLCIVVGVLLCIHCIKIFQPQNVFSIFFCESIGTSLFVSSDTYNDKTAHIWISPDSVEAGLHWELLL